MQKYLFFSLFMISLLGGLSSFQSDEIPSSHLKTINKTLGGLESELKNAVKTQKGEDLSKVFFENENTIIANHIVPENVKANKNIEALASKPLLKPNEFVQLLVGLYKGSGFAYEFIYDENEINLIDSANEKSQFVHNYKLPSKISVSGVINEQVQANFQKEVDLYITVFSDSKGAAKHCKIVGITLKGKPLPKKIEQPDNTLEVIDLSAIQKIEKLKGIFEKINTSTTEAQLEDIEKNFQGLISPSGAIRIVEGENIKSYDIISFIHLLKKQTMNLNYLHSSLILYDLYERNDQGKWFSRATTYHEVNRFDKGIPIPNKITKTDHVPMLSKSPSKKESYWLIFNMTFQLK